MRWNRAVLIAASLRSLLPPPLPLPLSTTLTTTPSVLARPFISSPPSSYSSHNDLRIVTPLLAENVFHRAADTTLDTIRDALEPYLEQFVPEADLEYSMGVLTIRLGAGKGTYVLNKQTPNRQLWLSSPVSGPIRYDLDRESSKWIYYRDHHELCDKLMKEISGLVGEKLVIE